MSPWLSQTAPATLGNLRTGFQASVIRVCARDAEDRGLTRLLEIGLVPGTPVEVLSEGSTMLVLVGEQRLSLRREVAETVQVFPVL